jgi:hypothetical protein
MLTTLEQRRPPVLASPRMTAVPEGDRDPVGVDAEHPAEIRRPPARDQMWSRWG